MTKPPFNTPSLPLSQTEDGSLATAPLSTVINAATNDLYQDFYNLVHSEIPIASSSANNPSSDAAPLSVAQSSAKSPGKDDTTTATTTGNINITEPTKKLRMSALSFAQRRHELTVRLSHHTKSIMHLYALTASSLPNSHSALMLHRSGSSHNNNDNKTLRLGGSVSTSSNALRFVRNAWQSADEAQDALYFHHDGLWRSRGHAHDVYGALMVGCGGYWGDFPTDVALLVDRYENSKECGYGVDGELGRRLAFGVRRKLVCGEVGEFGCVASSSVGNDCAAGALKDLNSKDDMPLPWKVVIEPGGGAIKLTYGTPRIMSTAETLRQQSHAEQQTEHHENTTNITDNHLQQYPMEARLSILSESHDAPWKLLSLHVQCSPKTGESDHQLRMNKKQMFDLHRIGERVMIVEEAICKKKTELLLSSSDSTLDKDIEGSRMEIDKRPIVSRPLLRLFEVTHSFALSMQLEMLSSQAEALRRGAWGGFVGIPTTAVATGGTTKETLGDGIAVSSVHFFEEGRKNDGAIAVMAVHFWSCDDRYGSPKVGDLSAAATTTITADGGGERVNKMETASSSASVSYVKNLDRRPDDNFLPASDCRGEKRLSLCIRAVPMVGLVVSLSGGSDVTSEQDHHMKRNIDKLLSSIQDPFQLSMSDALLAATVLCAQRRCRSVVDALNRQKMHKLPPWIHLEVECGSISVAARISYPTSSSDNSQSTRPYVILFRLACDSRTGRYLPVFPRSASLLRLLACHDLSASDTQALRSIATANAIHARSGSLSGKPTDGVAREATGRIVRDAFDALSRSVDTLGRKCGVGGEWNDVDKQSASLREKSVDQSCRDVMVSLMTCCGMAAVFGVGSIALKIACGVDPAVDIAGGPIKDESTPDLLNVPPLNVILGQRMIERIEMEGDGDTKRIQQVEAEVFSLTAKVNGDSLEFACFDVLTLVESASAVPLRLKYASVAAPAMSESGSVTEEPPAKKARTTVNNNASYHHTLDEVKYATSWFDSIIRQ